MTRKTLVTFGIVVALLVSLFGTVAAQTGDTPPPVPPSDSDGTGSELYTHPVVQILSAYFGRNLGDTTDPEAPTDPTDPTDPENPLPDDEPAEDPQQTLAEEIAAYHEQGIGFGVLVKLYAMAEAAQEACPTEPNEPTGDTPTGDDTGTEEPTCTPVTVDDLITEMQSGKGMGQLFKEYGKPALLGVGHVKKALKEGQDQEEPETPVTTEDQKGKKPAKDNKKGKGNH